MLDMLIIVAKSIEHAHTPTLILTALILVSLAAVYCA